MYNVISIVVSIIGGILLLAPEYLIKKDTENETFKMILEYHQVIGLVCFVIAYYMYQTYNQNNFSRTETTTVESSKTEVSELPSYEKSN